MKPVANGVASPGPRTPEINPQQVRNEIREFETLSPWTGFFKALIGTALLGSFIYIALTRESWSAFFLWALIVGSFNASFFLLTHDAIHRTLTGWRWFDELFPRVLAYPMLWYHGIYAALHKIHHKMNGNDIDDPERPQWTEDEYRKASRLGRWAMRNQLWLNCFVWGGFGFLFKHYWQAYKYYNRSREVRRAIWTDVMGVVLVQGLINAWAISVDNWWRTFILFIIAERIMGAFHQFRSYIEHYGLWGKESNPYETQIRNSRNIKTNAFMSLVMDHLNYHSVHHAFPRVPFYKLREAHIKLKAFYKKLGRPMQESDSYLGTGLEMGLNPVVIATQSAKDPKQIGHVIPISKLKL